MNEPLTVLAWTLIHLVWQGTAVAAAAALLLAALHRSTPDTRYCIAVVALVSMMAAPIVTARVLRPAAAVFVPASTAIPEPIVRYAEFHDRAKTEQFSTAVPNTKAWQPSPSFLKWVVAAWATGVLLLLARLAIGLRTVIAWRTRARRLAPSSYQAVADTLTTAWGLRRVQTVVCGYVAVPMLIGYFRPLILLPAALLTSLTPEQIEAILAHELAHLRRHDALVNAVQLCAETLLFYHPAVWWLSSRIRDERELCCDAVVATDYDRASYADALLKLNRFRNAYPSMRLSAADGSLLRRVQRLLGETPRARPLPALIAIGAVVASLAIQPMPRRIAAASDGGVDAQVLSGRTTSSYMPLPFVSSTHLNLESRLPARSDFHGQPPRKKGETMSNQVARVIGGIAVASTLVGPAVAQPPNGYALVIARPDGALGPYLHRANIDCATLRVTMTAPPSRENLPCNLRRDIGRISASGLPFEQFVGMLRVHTHLWIEDRTGLSGDFDWDLAWTPENLRATADRFPGIDPNGPSVFAAVEAQLGLRLVPLNAA